LVGLPVLVLHLASNLASIRVYLVVISTMFVGLAVPISLYSIRRHLLHFWVPPLQIYIVRILWMVPVYSVCTLCSLWLWVCGQEPYVYIPDAFRQCYESYTLYNLFGFMIAYLEMDQGLSAAQILRRAHPTVSFVTHAPPFSLRLGGKYGFLGCCASGDSNSGSPLDQLTRQDSNGALDGHSSGAKQTLLGGNDSSGGGSNTTCVGRLLGPARRIDLLSPWAMGDEFVKNCRRGVLFYVATMPPLALLIVVLSLLGLYHEGNFSLYSPYFWIQAFYFGTSCWALYCLALFFVVARKELAPVKPLNKFLLVKGIVFFTWAQSLAISLAFYFVYDYKARHWTSEAARAAILGNGNGESADEGSYYDDGYDEEARKAAAVQALEDERMTNAGAVCDAVMCVEMLFFAIGHAMAFPSTQFQRVMPHHTTVLGDGPSDGTANGKPGGEEEAPLKAAAAAGGGSGDGGAAAAAVAAVAKRRLAENKQWLVEWGDYWAHMRHSPAGVKYQNERMFGVADVHADTTETYRLVGSAVSDFAREAKVKTAAAAQSTRANLDKTLEKTRENLARGGGGGGGGGGGQPASPPSSPLPLPPRRDKEAASSPAALSSAAKDAERRGHSAFAKLLQSKTETPTAAAAAADTAAGGGGGGGAPSVYYSAKSSCEFESSSDDDDDGDEDTGLLV